ncbi:MAG: DUF2017 family protein [bacterium]|nr:DUF2017 family protein [bacterium]
MSRFRANAGGIEISLMRPEIALLERLGSLLSGAGVEKDDPARERLFPKIYLDDNNASREFERLAGKEYVEVRSVDREAFNRGLKSACEDTLTLTLDEAGAWVRVIGEARIVLAARRGFFEKGLPEQPVDDPEVAFVMFLGIIQEELVGQMLKSMEDTK